MTDGVRRCERLVVRLKGALGRLPPRELRRPRKALLAHLLCDGAIAQYPDEVAGKPCRILRISQQGSVAHHLGNRPTGMRKPATWKASCLTWWLISKDSILMNCKYSFSLALVLLESQPL